MTLRSLYSRTTDHDNEYGMLEGEISLPYAESYSFSNEHGNEYW